MKTLCDNKHDKKITITNFINSTGYEFIQKRMFYDELKEVGFKIFGPILLVFVLSFVLNNRNKKQNEKNDFFTK
jgi:hypothetical protein